MQILLDTHIQRNISSFHYYICIQIDAMCLHIHIFIIKDAILYRLLKNEMARIILSINHDFFSFCKVLVFDVLRNPFGLWSTCCLESKVIQTKPIQMWYYRTVPKTNFRLLICNSSSKMDYIWL